MVRLLGCGAIRQCDATAMPIPEHALGTPTGEDGRDPALQNIGNPSMTLNNGAKGWEAGTLFLTKQARSATQCTHTLHAPTLVPAVRWPI